MSSAGSEALLLLVRVASPLREALVEQASGQNLKPVVIEPGRALPMGAGEGAVCVVQPCGPEEQMTSEVSTLTKLLGNVPMIALSGPQMPTLIHRLLDLGVTEFVDLPADPVRILSTAAKQAAAAGPMRRWSLGGTSGAMQAIRKRVASVAPSPATVLLVGETGVGKGLVAREIHERSGRLGRLVHVDCAMLSFQVIESELFGHERGAFTGAHRARAGRFEEARSGTIFLDEIGNVPLDAQVKLLRVLQDRQFERVGGNATIHSDARVIAATNVDLSEAVRQGRFRPDLYYRLNVMEIRVPPLRERRSDIPALVDQMLEQQSARMGLLRPTLTDGFLDRLQAYDWPGNVRELQNLLERLLVEHGPVELTADLLPMLNSAPRSDGEDSSSTDGDEIRAALEDCGWHNGRAATLLGITVDQLRYRRRKHGIRRPRPR